MRTASHPRTWIWIAALVLGLAVVARPAGAASGDEFYAWVKWRLGHAPYTCQAGAPWVRPNVRPRVPQPWWEQLKRYAATPCTQAQDPPEEPTETPIVALKLTGREAALRDAVNAERTRHGLAPLAIVASLQNAARAHTTDMIRHRYFSHDWHNGARSERGSPVTPTAPPPARSWRGVPRSRLPPTLCDSGSTHPGTVQPSSRELGRSWASNSRPSTPRSTSDGGASSTIRT